MIADRLHRRIDAALDVHRIGARRDRFHAFLDDRLSDHRCGRGAVAGNAALLCGDLAHHLRAHVLELVFKLDLLGDGHAVLADARRAIGLLKHDVASLRTERDLDRIGQDVDAANHKLTGFA